MIKQVYALLIPLLWLAWMLYWRVSARHVKPIERREPWLSRMAHIVPMIIMVVIFVTPDRWYGPLAGLFLPRSEISYFVGVALLALGLGFASWARHVLGGNWSGTVTLKKGHELIRSGPYRFARHPIYTGLFTGIFGCAIALGEWRGLIALGLVFAAYLWKMRREERWMGERFGADYARYREQVPALIPFLKVLR